MRSVLLVVALLSIGCGGDSNPVGPTAAAPSVEGLWTGNLESSNWPARAVNLQLTQAGGSVNGTWAASDGSDWNGTISGSVSGSSFSGNFTMSAPNATGVGVRCTGNGSVSGSVTPNATTLRWTSPGFTGSCNGQPLNVVWNLQRR